LLIKFSNINFVLNPSIGIQVIRCARTDGRKKHHEPNTSSSDICEVLDIFRFFIHEKYLQSTDLGVLDSMGQYLKVMYQS
jgi:hypothetical protein